MSQWPEDLAEDIEDLVRITSSSVTKRYWKYVPAGDIRQAVEEHAWRNREKICKYLRDENRKAGWAAASKALHRAGERYARKAKADRLGYNPRDEFFYDKILISEVIRYAVSGVVPAPDEETEYIRAPRDPAEGGNLNAMLADKGLQWVETDPSSLAAAQDRLTQADVPVRLGRERKTVERVSSSPLRQVETQDRA